MPAKRRAKKLPYIPPSDELERIVRATTRERDRLMLMLGLYAGLRVSEITKLTVRDLDFSRHLLAVREGKGCKDRVLPIPQFLQAPLRGWVGARRSGPLFPSPQGGGHLTTRAVQYLVKRLAAKAGLEGAAEPRRYHPHALRHGFATERLRRKVNPVVIQKMLGHSNLATTMVYLHVMPEDLREGMDA